MSELSNYSIETDHSVWLSFRDGRSFRVSFGQLPKYLAPRDLTRVRRAIKLRHDFLRHHMPRTIVALMALGLIAAMFAGGSTLAQLITPQGSVPPTSTQTEVVRHLQPAQDQPEAAPSPASPPAVVVAPRSKLGNASGASKRAATSFILPAPIPKPIERLMMPVVEITPIVTAPLKQSGVPLPTPLPAPVTLPGSEGQILGGSTPPASTPTPTPTPKLNQ